MTVVGSFLRRCVLMLWVLVPLAACTQERSPWENMNYNAAINTNIDNGI